MSSLREAQHRHSAYYLSVLEASADLCSKGGSTILEGLHSFHVERWNIESGQAWAAANVAKDPLAAALCSEYSSVGGEILSIRQHPIERERWLKDALTAARILRDRSAEAAHLGNLGLAYYFLGKTSQAIKLYNKQLKISRELGRGDGECNALRNLGNAYGRLGKVRSAIDCHERSLSMAREMEDRRNEAASLGCLGVIFV